MATRTHSLLEKPYSGGIGHYDAAFVVSGVRFRPFLIPKIFTTRVEFGSGFGLFEFHFSRCYGNDHSFSIGVFRIDYCV